MHALEKEENDWDPAEGKSAVHCHVNSSYVVPIFFEFYLGSFETQLMLRTAEQISATVSHRVKKQLRGCGCESLVKFRRRGVGTSSSLHLDDNLSSRRHANKSCCEM